MKGQKLDIFMCFFWRIKEITISLPLADATACCMAYFFIAVDKVDNLTSYVGLFSVAGAGAGDFLQLPKPKKPTLVQM